MTTAALPLAQQWTLQSLQVVNWGCFDGHLRVEFGGPQEVTLITGATGSGKSTLLDAHIVLMHDPKTALNRASNTTRHRSRSSETRNIVSYMRGVTGQTRDIDGEHDVMLREGTVWSAIAETWRSNTGDLFTAVCAFFSTVNDTVRPALRRDMWIHGDFDLRWLEPFVTGVHIDAPLPTRQLERTFPGLTVAPSPTALHRVLWRKLDIGTDGDGINAMALLYKVQAADAVESVNDLFTKFVLDTPCTYVCADQAIEHFTRLRDSHTKVATIEDQMRRLSRIPSLWDKYTAGREELEFLTSLNVTPVPSGSSFWKWRRDREYTALDAAEEVASSRYRSAQHEATEAQAAVVQLEAEWSRISAAIAADSSLSLLSTLTQSIAEADKDRRRADDAREALQAAVGVILTVPTTRPGYDRQRAASQAAKLGYPQAREQAERAHREAQQVIVRLLDRRRDLRRQEEHFSGRGDVTDTVHDEIRTRYATLLAVPTLRVPFVGELVDMRVEYEGWRLAAEKALGGFARTLLVPAADLPAFRRIADAERTRRRIRYLAVPDATAPIQSADPATIAGRLQYRNHPFAGWLSAQIARVAGHLCVSSPDELGALPDRYSEAVTINGQIATRDGGYVGGQIGHQPSIGFSPEAVLSAIRTEIAQIEEQLVPAEAAESRTRTALDNLAAAEHAHDRLLETPWDLIDVAAAEHRLQELTDRRMSLTESSTAHTLIEQSDQIQSALSTARDHAARTRATTEDLDRTRASLADRKDQAWTHFATLDQLPDPDLGRLDTLLTEFRDGPGAPVSVTHSDFLDPAWGRFIRHLDNRYKAAEAGRRDAHDVLTQTFEDYLRAYPDPTLSGEPDRYYTQFHDILDRHTTSGVDGAKAEFTQYAAEYGGHELTALSLAYQNERDIISARLSEINAALASQPYGAEISGRIKIISRDGHAPTDVVRFKRGLHDATAGATSVLSYDEAAAKFNTFDELISQIADPKRRDLLLDVRRHIMLEAQHIDHDALVAFYRDLGAKSGGETQELTMFIIAAAIRYRVGSVDGSTPRFAPVFMDEGLIKADPERTQRSVNVWTHLGFQPIIATTADKHESVSHTATVILCVSKDPSNRSRIDAARAEPPPEHGP